jgi:hypothetical protein
MVGSDVGGGSEAWGKLLGLAAGVARASVGLSLRLVPRVRVESGWPAGICCRTD